MGNKSSTEHGFPGCQCLPGSGINTHHGHFGGEEHPHQIQEVAERGQEGHIGVENTKMGWQNWALGSKRAGL